MWNFRVVRNLDDFAVYYAYYGDGGELKSLSVAPVSPTAEDVEALRETLALMLKACDDPVIESPDVLISR